MKHNKSLFGSISILIGAVIAILALTRGTLQIAILIVTFSVWGLWVVTILLLPYMSEARRRQKRK